MRLAKYFGVEIEIVKSAAEYGLRIGKETSISVGSVGIASDEMTATLTRNSTVVS